MSVVHHTKVTRSYIVNRKTGERHCVGDVRESSHQVEGEVSFSEVITYSVDQLPPRVDLRRWMTPVEHQGKTLSCTANALAGACEYLIKRSSNRHIDVSRLFIYYNARKRELDITKSKEQLLDFGSAIPFAVEALKLLGVCRESLWPFDIQAVNKKPVASTYTAAKEFMFPQIIKLKVDLNEMRTCLAQGFPFIFGIYLFSDFDKASVNGGVVPAPSVASAARTEHRSHSMLAVGYSDRHRRFIVRNSWGVKWGKDGYCFIDYDYMANPKHCFSVYAVKQMSVNDFGTAQWDADDSDVLFQEILDETFNDDDIDFINDEEDDEYFSDSDSDADSNDDGNVVEKDGAAQLTSSEVDEDVVQEDAAASQTQNGIDGENSESEEDGCEVENNGTTVEENNGMEEVDGGNDHDDEAEGSDVEKSDIEHA